MSHPNTNLHSLIRVHKHRPKPSHRNILTNNKCYKFPCLTFHHNTIHDPQRRHCQLHAHRMLRKGLHSHSDIIPGDVERLGKATWRLRLKRDDSFEGLDQEQVGFGAGAETLADDREGEVAVDDRVLGGEGQCEGRG